MQAITTVHPNTHKAIIEIVSDKLNLISGNTYLQLGQVIAIISLVFWLATFKANAEYRDERHGEEIEKLKSEVLELKKSIPSKDWLELKFQNLNDQIIIYRNRKN